MSAVSASKAVEYEGAASSLRDVWVAVRASLRRVLESTSLQDVVDGELPDAVIELHGRSGGIHLAQPSSTCAEQ